MFEGIAAKTENERMPIPIIYIGAAMLLIGVAPLPYGYYLLLRVVATGIFIWAAFVSHERKNEILPWVFGALAILFNPIFKIHLTKEVWMAVDVAAAIFLFIVKDIIVERNEE